MYGHKAGTFLKVPCVLEVSLVTESDSSSPPAAIPLVAESVSKQYPGGLWANRDISLTIGPSEILGLLGPNGSGKTTFVRQITTVSTPIPPSSPSPTHLVIPAKARIHLLHTSSSLDG